MLGLPVVRPCEAESSYPLIQGPGEPIAARTSTIVKRALTQTLPPEVMSMIFTMSDKRTCAAACLVCRRWNGVAMDELWRTLPSLQPLFGLLGPLVDTGDGHDLHPDCLVTPQSWHLFRSHAARVRSLTYDEVDSNDRISTALVLRTLAVHPGEILPNLRSVSWSLYASALNHPLAFCPPSLERMCIHIDNYYFPEDAVKRLLYDLSSALANRLQFFEFGIYSSLDKSAAITNALLTFLKSQGGLLELKLPSYEIQDLVTISEVCQALPQLRSFCGEFSNLTKEMFHGVLNALGRRGASLRCVRLIGLPAGELESISLTDMEPMLQLTVIEDIGFWLDCKLELEVRDVQQMGQAWNGLKSLILFPDDGILLRHLITFAEWFPVLQRFATRFDCSADIPSPNEVPSRFKSLRRLKWFGAQIADSQRLRVAEFLAVVCGPSVEVGISRNPLYPDEIFDEMSPWEASSEDAGLRHWIDAFHRVHEAINRMK